MQIEFQNKIYERIDRATGETLIRNEDIKGAWTVLRNIIVKSATLACGTGAIEILTGDALRIGRIRVVVNDKKQAYLGKWNTTGLSDNERIRLENDSRDKSRKMKILFKESNY